MLELEPIEREVVADRYELVVGEPFGRESLVVFASTAPQGQLRGEDIGDGLSLLNDSLDGIRGKSRGIDIRAKRKGNVKREYFEAPTKLTTRP